MEINDKTKENIQKIIKDYLLENLKIETRTEYGYYEDHRVIIHIKLEDQEVKTIYIDS